MIHVSLVVAPPRFLWTFFSSQPSLKIEIVDLILCTEREMRCIYLERSRINVSLDEV